MNAKGKVFKYGDNVDTDVIIPARYLNIADPKELSTHAMEDIDADFCLRAKGESMIGARILDGDLVFIRSQSQVDNGEIAAVLIGDEATLKRIYYYPQQNRLMLNAENPAFAPLIYIGDELEQIKILGKAVAFQSPLH